MSVSGGFAVGPGLFFQFLGLAFGFLFRVIDGRIVLAMFQRQAFCSSENRFFKSILLLENGLY